MRMLPYTRGVEQDILEAFLEAVRQVFRETDIPIESVEAAQEPQAEDHVITSIGLTGDLKGILMLRTDLSGAAGILHAMTSGIRLPAREDMLTELQMAALAELSNQISGRAITLLSDLHLNCDITPPAVVAARHLRSHVPDLPTSFSRTLRGPFGRITLFVGLQARELLER
jgi:CheY-specific phosphatase CheX